ncbi:hypothetical protein [Streptomyces sp. NPDC001843]|uniref:hypothetical protein n=1 Tax=Streptomyces sp. NPDC001843 TaxID=3364617 RepID=UPI0036B4EA2C
MRQYGPDVLDVADPLTRAYVAVCTAPPWQHRNPAGTGAAFRERLTADARRPGFRAVLSFGTDAEVDGFVTGWITEAPFRTERACGSVTERLGADRVDELLVGALEIDELGVRPGLAAPGWAAGCCPRRPAGRPAAGPGS